MNSLVDLSISAHIWAKLENHPSYDVKLFPRPW